MAHDTLAQYAGEFKATPNILWIGTGNFWFRLFRVGTFDALLRQHGASLTFADVNTFEQVVDRFRLSAEERVKVLEFFQHPNVKYSNIANPTERQNLLYNRVDSKDRVFTHIYIANWPEQHILSAMRWTSLAPRGVIIITKPLDLNIPQVQTIAAGKFPGFKGKIFVDDHYRNKSSVRALHRMFGQFSQANGLNYGKLKSFRMWLVERKTAEDENRREALECGLIWDLATHLISFIQLFFLDAPHLGLSGYAQGNYGNPEDVRMEIRKVLRMRYVGCELKREDAETLAVIEVAIIFGYQTYGGPVETTVSGLLVVGKGAARFEGVTDPVKQLDFSFERGPVSLNYNSGKLWPEFHDYRLTEEHGFFEPVIELLTHSLRQDDDEGAEPAAMPEPGRYHCGVPFDTAFRNVMTIDEILRHPMGRKLLQGYRPGEAIGSIMDWLVGRDYLERDWLDEVKYGKFV